MHFGKAHRDWAREQQEKHAPAQGAVLTEVIGGFLAGGLRSDVKYRFSIDMASLRSG
jgi:hypothetical protein